MNNEEKNNPTILGQFAMGFAIGTFILPIFVFIAVILGAIDWNNKGKRGKKAVFVSLIGFFANIILSLLFRSI